MEKDNILKDKASIFLSCLSALFLLYGLLFPSPSIAADDSVCARVKIEIQQELTLERQAFDAHMRINNGLSNITLENVDIDVSFSDENGNIVRASFDPNDTTALFFIRLDSMENINNVDGTGTVQPSSTADIHWLIIPAPGASNGLLQGKLYYVGATLKYTIGGEEHVTTVTPDYIFVKPVPELTLDYFLPTDVYGDDAFTPEIEPVIPFSIGVRVKNSGAGVAKNLKIDSAQPKIVENEQGLLIGFFIEGTEVNGQTATNSLLADFGDIQPNTSGVARWIMTCTLSGKFVEFTAEFSHSDELGGELTSLIDAVNTHFLVHDVLVDLPGRDNIRDFLAKDGGVYRVYESDNVDTEALNQSASSTLQFTSQVGSDMIYTLSTPITAGFMYVQLPDPYRGQKVLKEVIRSDGKRIKIDNIWLSKTRVKSDPWQHFINLFDVNTTNVYTIVFGDPAAGPRPPVLQFIPDRTGYEGQQISFIVEASDPDGTIPVLSATPLPAGAIFRDQGNLGNGIATGIFDWTPAKGQAGKYEITFTASDGLLKDTKRAVLTIKSESDNNPPTGSIRINNGNKFTASSSVTLNLLATDEDGISQMCISNTSTCSLWEPYVTSKQRTLESGDGTKTIYAWFKDNLGNANTTPYSASITLDTTAPVLTVSTLSDGSWTNNQTLNISGTVTDNIGVEKLTINGTDVTINEDNTFSHAIVLQDGENIIEVIATDLADNQKTDTRKINFDTTAPNIVITSPADNSKTKQSTTELAGTVDEDSIVTVSVNGGSPVPAQMKDNIFSLTVTLAYGMNTIEAMASDMAGNIATAKRTVMYDDQNPALSITEPAQDVKTNQNSMVIKGEVSDITKVTVTITKDSEVYTPDIVDGKFEQPLTFTSEKTYPIYVKATDELGNETTVQRNIIYDKTPPAVTVDPVTSPTKENSQVLTGTMEERSTVMVSCPTASVGTVTYPTPTTWTATLTNMAEGNNEITVAAFDLVPNTSDGIKAVIVVDTAVPDSIIISKPNNLSNSNIADFVFTATETGSSFQCQLDKGGYTACASPMNYTGLAEGDHTFSVTAIDAAGNVDETPDSYTWAIDTTPPSSTIAAPKNGDAIMTTTFTIKGTASDTGSGIQRVEISTDGGKTWNLAMGTTSWSYIWTIPADGTYTIKSRATDAAGNVETPGAGIQVTVDKTAPALIISTLSDGSWTNNQTLNVAGTATDNIGMQSLTINGTELTINPDGTYSHAIILQIGANAINIIAEDLAGNQTTDTRTVNFDPAGPVLLITLPPDNIKTKESTIQVEGAVDETSVIDISVNNEPYIPVEVIGNNFVVLVGLSYGINNIELMATDRAGNTSSVKRTVTYDNQDPALSVTLPDQDIKTNQESIVIRGEVTDLTTINVTITMDGNTYTPVITGGVFEQTVTFTTEKTYNIYVTATDEAGNQTNVQRNVIYDRTAPLLSIDPVTSQTSQKTQVLTGTVESGLAVTITCSTATVGAVIYPSLTTWTVTLTNMTAGDNQIAVSSIDTAGNISTVTVSITLYATYRISGGAYFYPESPTYKASFSMDVTTGLTPSGWLKYYYARTRMNFVSTSITNVTVSGNTATISGTGTVNGASVYTFTARVTDGVPDSFGITINKPDGSLYYSAPTKAVSGGDLIISLL